MHVAGGRSSSGTPTRRRSRRSSDAAARGTTLRRADRARGRARRGDRRRGAVGRDGAPRLLRHRGGDERGPARARLHPPRPHPQVRGLLPRPRRRAARERRLRASPRSGSRRARACRRRHDRRHDRRRPYNDVDATAAAVERYGEGLAAIIVEPVAGNMGVVPPAPGFLEALRALCDASGALLVFDEVITGFRVARGGAQERYGVCPDLTDPRQDRRRRPAARGVRRPRRRDGAARAGRRRLPGRARSPGTRSRPPPGSRCCAGCATRRVYERARAQGARLEAGLRAVRPRPARRRDADALPRPAGPSATSRTRRRATPSATARSSATCSSAASTSRRRSSSACSSRSPTPTRTSTGRWRPLPTSSATDLWDDARRARRRPRARSGRERCGRPSRERSRSSRRSAPERFALGLETIYEGYLVHYGRPRLFAPADARHGAAARRLPLRARARPHRRTRGGRRGRRPRRADLALRAAARRGRARRRLAWAATALLLGQARSRARAASARRSGPLERSRAPLRRRRRRRSPRTPSGLVSSRP